MCSHSSSTKALIESVDEVIKNSAVRVNGNAPSIRTIEYTQQVLRESCRRLHSLGYFITHISALRETHVEALVTDWHKNGLGNKTMQNQLSRLKIFAGWLGKSEIIKPGGLAAYLTHVDPKSLKVKTYSDTSKSWTGNGIDVIDVIKKAHLEDQRLWCMLLLGLSFGLRKKEMLRIKPWRSDTGRELKIDGSVAKNGRLRTIPIDEEIEYGKFQRWCLDQAKSVCKKTETLGWPQLTYKQSENRFYHYMRRLGINKADSGILAHGLRAEFAENMSLIMGMVPPSLGGSIEQLPKLERKAITNSVSNLLGHDDEHTIGAYYSTFRPVAHTDGVGVRVGPIIIVNAHDDVYAGIHINPHPIKGPDGYRALAEEERKNTSISVVVEFPWQENQNMELGKFVETYPHLEGKVRSILTHVGMGLR